ncbi:MAG: hypothetical protein ABFS08_06635 [Pseudomonadota bacterium]
MRKLVGLLFTLLIISSTSAFAGSKAAINEYIAIFKSGSYTEQQKACKRLQWAGISDTRIFDLVEANLLAGYKSANSKAAINEMAWLSKALGFSGKEKYRATIEAVAADSGHKKLRKHGKKSIQILNDYIKWQPIISSKKNYNKGKSAEINRYANMLKSSELGLNLYAAKRVYNRHIDDKYLLNILKKSTENRLADGGSSKDYIQTTAYMLKALAVTREAKYLAVVEDAAANASNRKVRKYAVKYLKQYR